MTFFRVKICGNRTPADLELAASAGADYAGVVLEVPTSPRSVTLSAAAHLRRAASLPLVAVLLDADLNVARRAADALRPAAVQLHGAEPPEVVQALKAALPCQVWKAVHVRPAGEAGPAVEDVVAEVRAYASAGADVLLLDTAVGQSRAGGTGVVGDWRLAAEVVAAAERPVLLAGGLRPETVGEAVQMARPAGVDVASGVERAPGCKDPEAVRRFVAAARRAASRM